MSTDLFHSVSATTLFRSVSHIRSSPALRRTLHFVTSITYLTPAQCVQLNYIIMPKRQAPSYAPPMISACYSDICPPVVRCHWRRGVGLHCVVQRSASVYVQRSDLLRYLLILLLLVHAAPYCLSVGSRQQYNVWYNGLWISGIAVVESSGDVFFSDAAGRRVVHQSAEGALLHIFDDFYSPMKLVYHNGTVYVTDSSSRRLGLIDVQSGSVTFSPPSPHLTGCSAVTVNSGTGSVFVVDGYGLGVEMWSPRTQEWTGWIDMSAPLETPPVYLSSIALQSYETDAVQLWLNDPTSLQLYVVDQGEVSVTSFFVDVQEPVNVQFFSGGATRVQLYVLGQPPAGQIREIALIDSNGALISQWYSYPPQQALPSFGWAMFVDELRSMYVADAVLDAHGKPYTRLVKLAVNGTVVNQWTMNDTTAQSTHSPTAVWYEYDNIVGGSCAFWMVDGTNKLRRMAANGALSLPFFAAPVDPADNRTAQFTALVGDGPNSPHFNESTLILLDTADPLTTKIWRFVPSSHGYILLNTSYAQLGGNITAVAVDAGYHNIILWDTRTKGLFVLDYTGIPALFLNASETGLVEPVGMYCLPMSVGSNGLFVADMKYGAYGAVLLLDYASGTIGHVFNDSNPRPSAPLAVTVDTYNKQMYTADSEGDIYQFDLSRTPYVLRAVHQLIPALARWESILSMTVSAAGDLYAVNSYSRRLIILPWEPTGWNQGNDCLPSIASSSASSSTATIVATPTAGQPSSTSALSWSTSSSSSASAHPASASNSSWSAAATAGVVVAGAVIAVAVLVSWCCVQQRKRKKLLRTSLDKQQITAAAEVKEEVEMEEYNSHDTKKAGLTFGECDSRSVVTGVEAADNEAEQGLSIAVSDTVSDGGSPSITTRGRRYEYYVARYEVIAALERSAQQPASEQQSQSPPHPFSNYVLSTRDPQPTWPQPSSSQPSTGILQPTDFSSDSTSASAVSLFTSSPALVQHVVPPATRSVATADLAPSAVSALSSPAHIAELQSAWPSNPMFIDSVTDLVILGEGSSGVVYRGMYRGVACVVKLPKSVSLTGAAWREWQCHLCLPPHANLVRFLGALPMSANNYLVLSLVRQGSLHSLIASDSESGSWYRRPYGVMRCVRDMSSVLQHIHSCGIVHRDVSCRNILVDSDGRMVLADLGLAAQIQQLSLNGHGRSGQPVVDESKTAVPVRWTSPESLLSSRYSGKSDVWSLGVALWEMTAGGRLPYGERQTDTKACIQPIVARQLQLHVDDEWGRWGSLSSVAEWKLAGRVRQLIQLCLTYEVELRPESGQLVQLVNGLWEEWKVEAGSDHQRLHNEWVEYHDQLQQRLGPTVADYTDAESQHRTSTSIITY